MGLKSIWKSYKVLLVMGAGLGVMHWGWYNMQFNPLFHPNAPGRLPSVFRVFTGSDTDSKDK